MRNHIFDLALAQATRLAGQPGRLIRLVAQVSLRLYKTDRAQLSLGTMHENLRSLGRLVNSYAKGRYREIPLKTFVTIVAALLYFLNPFDLVPDAIPGFGMLDDFTVLTWVYGTAQQELNKFLAWEKTCVAQQAGNSTGSRLPTTACTTTT